MRRCVFPSKFLEVDFIGQKVAVLTQLAFNYVLIVPFLAIKALACYRIPLVAFSGVVAARHRRSQSKPLELNLLL